MREYNKNRNKTEDSSIKKRMFQRKKTCRFCGDKTILIDFKEIRILKMYVTERGKIIPRRISGNCALHQLEIKRAIKRARSMALLPYTTTSHGFIQTSY